MSYIGNAPITAAFLVDTFSGTGSQTAFTMTVAPANTSSIIVAITGVLQDPSTYSVSGTTLTFSAAPPSGTNNISVRYLGIPASGVTTTAYRTVTNTTATAGQTSFTIPSYTVGYVDVYRNGVYLPTSDYTATTGTTVVLTNAATVGDTITTISFYVSSVLNAIPATAGAVANSYLGPISTLTVSGGTLTLPSTTGTVLSSTTQLIGTGVTNASSAATGYVGEYVEGVNSTGTTVANGGWTSVTSITLTAGDWDIAGNLVYYGASGSNTVGVTINSTSGSGSGTLGFNQAFAGTSSANGVGQTTITRYRVNITSTTTYYLNGFLSGSSNTCYGTINARRMR